MNTRKIAINVCYGGFGLSDETIEKYLTKKKIEFTKQSTTSLFGKRGFNFFVDGKPFSQYDIKRDDPFLIESIIEIGIENASDRFSLIKIVEIPIDIEWQISDYDGMEWVAEKHRVWN